MSDIERKPPGRETGDFVVDRIADAVADRLRTMQGRSKRLYDIDEAAKYLSLSEESVRDLVGAGKLASKRPTRKLQFDIEDLDRFVKAS